jgi:hypothetical protein
MKKLIILLFTLISVTAFGQVYETNNIVRNNTLSPARVANALDAFKPYTATGTDTYAISPGMSIYAGGNTYASGDIWTVTFTNANTGAATLNVNSDGAIAIVDNSGSALSAGDLVAGGTYILRYNGTHFRIIGATGSGGGGGTGGNILPNKKTVSASTYTVQAADSLYTIHFTNACVVTLSNTLPDGFIFTAIRNDNGGKVTFQDDGTSEIGAVGYPLAAYDTISILYDNGIAQWEKDGATTFIGYGHLGELSSLGGGGAVSSVFGRTGAVVAVAGDYEGSEVTNTPAGNIAADDVQEAINELDTEKQPLDSDLTAVAGNATNGLLARTGSGTVSARIVTGTTNQITVTNGDGVSGNPTISLPSGLVLPSTTTGTTQTPGTSNTTIATTAYVDAAVTAGSVPDGDKGDIVVTGGVWAVDANVIDDAKLRQSAALSVIGRSANSTGNVADISAGTDHHVFRRSGSSIGFGSIDLSQSGTVGSSILPVANGGTGVSSIPWWALSGTSTLTGSTTITSGTNNYNQIFNAGTWTGTASLQFGHSFTSTITGRAGNADTYYGTKFIHSMTPGADAQSLVGVFINNTTPTGGFTNTSRTQLLIQCGSNSSGEVGLRVQDNSGNRLISTTLQGGMLFGSSNNPGIGAGNNQINAATGNGLVFDALMSSGNNTGYTFNTASFSHGSTDKAVMNLSITGSGYTASTGTGSVSMLKMNPTYNTTGGTQVLKGVAYEPIVTATSSGTTNYAWNHSAGFVAWGSVLSPAQITANQDNYNPTGWTNGGAPHGASHLRLNTDASRNLTSLAGGVEGRMVIISNVGSQNIVIKDDDGATGTAANRFALSADLTLAPDQSRAFIYDATSSRWRIVGQ